MGCDIVEHRIGSFRAITLTDGEFSLTLLPEKGSDIVSLRHEPTDTEFLWTSPNGLRADAGGGPKHFFDTYEGGWQECFPTGGPTLRYRGAEMGYHGEVHALRWRITDAHHDFNEASITLEVACVRTPFRLKKKITLRNKTGMVEIEEWATNEGEEDLPIMWGHHPAFGGNFLSAACKIDALAKKVWATVAPENQITNQFEPNASGDWPMLQNKRGELVDVSEVGGVGKRSADSLYIGEFQDGWVAITNRERKVGVAFLFNPEFHKTFWMWHMYGGGLGYPWYGRAYALAVQPFTGVPNPYAAEIDDVPGTIQVRAHQTVTSRLRLILYKGLKGVARISADGTIVPRI